MSRPRLLPRVWIAVLLASLILAPAASAIVPPNPERGRAAKQAFASLAAKGNAMQRGRPVSFRALAPGETRTLNALVLLVDFSDNAATRPPSDFTDLLLSSHTRPGGSLRDYYEENSNGRLLVAGAVVGWLRAPQSYTYYVDGQAGFGSYPQSAQRLAEDAIALARSRVNFAEFDDDGPDGIPSSGDDDGYVDALLVVHAGQGAEDAQDPMRQIWSHSSATSREIAGSGAIGFFYSMTPEISEVGVQCHEFGHTLGLPDLYDTTPPGSPDSHGLGIWSIMAIGSWAGPPGQAGARPSHLDPWCKARLGFVDPVDLERNLTGAVFHPVEEGGEVYRLWTNGDAGPEYFLAENRRPAAGNFDRYLPGSGLLVYHVDELSDDNDDESRYRVALLQADGLRDLEEETNIGDAGDPFPGTSVNRAVTETTIPSTRSNGGAGVQVAIASIDASDPSAIRADLTVERGPSLRLTSVRAAAGDGWPWLRWGETSALTVAIANVGLASGEAAATLVPDDPRVQVAETGIPLGALDEDGSASALFTVTTDEVPADTTLGIPARLLVAHDAIVDSLSVVLTAGRRFGLSSGFETDLERAGWTHGRVFPERRDNWTLTNQRAHRGGSSYRFTDAAHGTYLIDADGALISPPILLGVASRLEFWHWLSAERETGRYAYDGGRVEISVENGPWTVIEPEGGYPYRLDPFTSTMVFNERIYSGESDGWRQARFDLAGYSGSVRLRFRFISDQGVNLEGWYIDDVAVTTQPQRFSVSLPALAAEAGGIRATWRVEEVLGPYDGSGFRLYRGTGPAPGGDPDHGYELAAEVPSDSAGAFAFFDAGLESGVRYSYLLEELAASGAVRAVYGPASLFLTPSSGAPSVSAPYPNPFLPGRGGITLSYVIPGIGNTANGVARLSLYDILGRRVRVLDERAAAPGQVIVRWDGKDRLGRAVASGVYFVRLESPRGDSSRRFVVVR